MTLQVGSTGGPSGTSTRVSTCDGRTTTTTDPFGGIGDTKVWLRRFDLRKAFGHPFTLTDRRVDRGLTPNSPTRRELTTERWTFRFTPVRYDPERQRWRVEVRGRDRWSWGCSPGCGRASTSNGRT